MLSTSSVILPSPWMARSITGPSALDAPGAAAPSQLFHLGDRDYVAVALDGVLQSGGRQGVLHRRLGALSGQQEIDQAAVKAVVPVLKVRPFASVPRVDSSNSAPSRPK